MSVSKKRMMQSGDAEPKMITDNMSAMVKSAGIEKAVAGAVLGCCTGYVLFKVAMVAAAVAFACLLVAAVVSALQLVNIDWTRVTMLVLNTADWMTTKVGPDAMKTAKRLVESNTPFYGGFLVGLAVSIFFLI